MSPKNIRVLLSSFVRKVDSSDFKSIKVAIDGAAMLFFALKNARKEYHDATFSAERAANALADYKKHEESVAGFSQAYAKRCLQLMMDMFPQSVIVFDGGCPPEKSKEFGRRKKMLEEDRSNLIAAAFDFEADTSSQSKAKIFYTALGNCYEHRPEIVEPMVRDVEKSIEWDIVVGSGEADRICAKLCVGGEVGAVFSPDYDPLVYLCPVLIRDIDCEKADVIVLSDVLGGAGLTEKQFVDMCIVMGTDYNDKIYGVGPKKALALIKKYGSLENIEALSGMDLLPLNWRRVRDIFA